MKRLIRHIQLHPRLFISALIGAVVFVLLPHHWPRLTRLLSAWDVVVTLFLAMTYVMMLRETGTRLRRRAEQQDESGWTILFVAAGAAGLSLGALLGLLSGFKDLPDPAKSAYLVLVIYTIFGSWFFLHTLFTLHYAHEYYGCADDPAPGEPPHRAGLEFQGDADDLDYFDFAYYAFTIGMTAQTADTNVTSSTMRRLTLSHGLLSFVFNTVILALSINIAAGLL